MAREKITTGNSKSLMRSNAVKSYASRAEYINQSEAFVQAGAAIIRYDEAESAAALAEALLQDIDVPVERIDAIVGKIRNELAPPRRSLTIES